MPFPGHSADNDEFEARIRLTEGDVREAARLFRLLTDAVNGGGGDEAAGRSHVGSDQLVSRARIIFQSRVNRARHFNRAMFGEPAWDILLLLYINDLGGARLTATKIADMIEQPFSSVVRWLDYLQKERLIERRPHSNDKRIALIALLEKGRDSIESYLSDVPELQAL